MINEWSSNVPAHRRHELLSICFLVLFILFGGIVFTIAIIYLLVRKHTNGFFLLFFELNNVVLSSILTSFLRTQT